MQTTELCRESEFDVVAADVAAAMESKGRPSLGCVLMVGLTMVCGAMTQMDDETKQDVAGMVTGMLERAGLNGPSNRVSA